MSVDVFGRRALVFGGAFAADSAQIDLALECEGVDTSSGLLVQQLSVQYQQPITRLYEVGTQLTYYIAGRPQGTADLVRILGPGTVLSALYACLGDVCNAASNDICFCVQAGCLGNPEQDFNAIKLGLKNVVLQGLGFSVAAADMVINEQMSLFFTALVAEDDEDGCQFIADEDVTPSCF